MPWLRIVILVGIWLGMLVAVLFGAAGRLAWPGGRAWLALGVLTAVFNGLLLSEGAPALVRRRLAGAWPTRGFDRCFVVLYAPLVLALLALAGWEARDDPAAAPGSLGLGLGGLLHMAGDMLVVAALLANPWAEPIVRLQPELGQEVVRTGPYAWVRHPMYAGAIVMMAGWPLVLGSRLAWGPWLGVALLLIYRTACEDEVLAAELPGYAAYRAEVPWRLLPGVW